MTDETRKGPDLIAYTVRDRGEDKKAVWIRVGAAWKHRDEQGWDVVLDATPVDGRITLRELRSEEFKEQRRDEQTRTVKRNHRY